MRFETLSKKQHNLDKLMPPQKEQRAPDLVWIRKSVSAPAMSKSRSCSHNGGVTIERLGIEVIADIILGAVVCPSQM